MVVARSVTAQRTRVRFPPAPLTYSLHHVGDVRETKHPMRARGTPPTSRSHPLRYVDVPTSGPTPPPAVELDSTVVAPLEAPPQPRVRTLQVREGEAAVGLVRRWRRECRSRMSLASSTNAISVLSHTEASAQLWTVMVISVLCLEFPAASKTRTLEGCRSHSGQTWSSRSVSSRSIRACRHRYSCRAAIPRSGGTRRRQRGCCLTRLHATSPPCLRRSRCSPARTWRWSGQRCRR